MEEKLISIYQKDLKLNQILKEQISILYPYQIHLVSDEKSLIELLETQTLKLLILNYNNLSPKSLKLIIENFKSLNKIEYLIILSDKESSNLNINKSEVVLLVKPFKIINLLLEIEKLLSLKKIITKTIFF